MSASLEQRKPRTDAELAAVRLPDFNEHVRLIADMLALQMATSSSCDFSG
jgi:hypothetical protein